MNAIVRIKLDIYVCRRARVLFTIVVFVCV